MYEEKSGRKRKRNVEINEEEEGGPGETKNMEEGRKKRTKLAVRV